MAETQVVAGTSGPQTIPPGVKNTKNPPGRPRKDGLPAGSTKEVDIEQDIQEFFGLLQPATDDWWNSHTLYLYRQYPITDRRSAGKLLWIDKFAEPVDQERIMQLHGSGTYRLDLLHDGNKRVGTTSFRILNMDYPPVVPAGDWVDDPKNKDWEWCRPKLGPQVAGAAGGITPTELMNTMLRFKEATDQPKDSATDLIQALLDSPVIAALIPKPAPPPEPKEDKSGDRMFQMMMEDRKEMRAQLERLQTQLAERKPEKSWLEQALEKEDMMKRIFGRGERGSPEGWAGVANMVVEKVIPSLTPIGMAIVQGINHRASMQNRPNTAAPAPTVIQTTAIEPGAQQPSAAPPAPLAQQSGADQPMPDQNVLALWNKYNQVINTCLPFMQDQYRHGDGYALRDWFTDRYGSMVWGSMKEEVGVDHFVTMAKFDANIWKGFEPEEKFRAFLGDFFTDFGKERPEYDAGDDEDDAPVGAPPDAA